MKAWAIEGDGQSSHFVSRSIAEPEPASGQVIVEVRCAGLNRADLRFQPSHHARSKGIAGGEMAGIVIRVGPDCAGIRPGDRVMGLAAGCFAERIAIDHRLLLRVPSELDWLRAAAIPAAYFTAHDALVRLGGLRPGHRIMVQGATSSVGIAAMQVARFLGAAQVVAVGRSAGRLARLQPLFDQALVSDGSWSHAAMQIAGGRGFDIILDLVGGAMTQAHLECVASEGRIIAAGRLGGASALIDLDLLALRRATLIGTSFRSRTTQEKAEVVHRFDDTILPALADGRIDPIIDTVFPFEEAEAARRRLESPDTIGKIILSLE